MEQNFFEKYYPQISDLYSMYASSEMYNNNPIRQATDKCTSQLLKKVKNLYNQGDNFELDLTVLEYGATYQQSGFILGFQYAMNLIRESYS